jgi:hypothetical protein
MDDMDKFLAKVREHQNRMWPAKIKEMKEMPARFRGGDWSGLAEYLRDGGRVTPEIRLALVDALLGVLRQPRKKLKRPEDTEEMIALEVMLARRRGKKNATEGRTRGARQVSRYVKKHGRLLGVVAAAIEEIIEPALAKGNKWTVDAFLALQQCKPVMRDGKPILLGGYRPQKTPEHFLTP